MAITCTQAEHDALASAIKQGVTRVSYSDKSVQYESAAVMRATLAEMAEYLLGSAAPTRHSRAAFSRD
jgi:hypothetical protein